MSTKNVSVDTDIDNYSLGELMAIIEVQELEPNEIVKKTKPMLINSKSQTLLYRLFV